MVVGMEPNAENKLFVGGCPACSGEDDLRALFEKHGPVDEVFVMRGGSRSGMACAFVRFASQPSAQAAIDTIHGRITLPNASEPLVVRWADAPGSRKRDGREGGRGKRSGGGGGGGGMRDVNGGLERWPQQMMMANGLYGAYPQMMMSPQAPMMQHGQMLQQQVAAMGGNYNGSAQFYPQGASNFSGMVPQHMLPPGYPQHPMMVYMEQQGGMGGQPFWHVQGPPSPTQQMGAMMALGPGRAEVPPGGVPAAAANASYASMRPDAAPMPIPTGVGTAVM